MPGGSAEVKEGGGPYESGRGVKSPHRVSPLRPGPSAPAPLISPSLMGACVVLVGQGEGPEKSSREAPPCACKQGTTPLMPPEHKQYLLLLRHSIGLDHIQIQQD
uniref:Uncharacterized protein n=1 Tax=Knipowitschia caucasica TaxID=637954 RepID=A0AAV2L654_KNICA